MPGRSDILDIRLQLSGKDLCDLDIPGDLPGGDGQGSALGLFVLSIDLATNGDPIELSAGHTVQSGLLAGLDIILGSYSAGDSHIAGHIFLTVSEVGGGGIVNIGGAILQPAGALAVVGQGLLLTDSLEELRLHHPQ